jgi:hypothetical protein
VTITADSVVVGVNPLTMPTLHVGYPGVFRRAQELQVLKPIIGKGGPPLRGDAAKHNRSRLLDALPHIARYIHPSAIEHRPATLGLPRHGLFAGGIDGTTSSKSGATDDSADTR